MEILRVRMTGEKRRKLIKAKALELMSSMGGFNALTMERLAEACNLSKGGLYHYFGNKEELLFELMADGNAYRSQKAHALLESGFDPQSLTAALVEKVLDQSAYKRLYSYMLLQAMADPEYDRVLRTVEDQFWNESAVSMMGGLTPPPGVEKLFTFPVYWFCMSLMVGAQFFDRATEEERRELVTVAVRAVVEYTLGRSSLVPVV